MTHFGLDRAREKLQCIVINIELLVYSSDFYFRLTLFLYWSVYDDIVCIYRAPINLNIKSAREINYVPQKLNFVSKNVLISSGFVLIARSIYD